MDIRFEELSGDKRKIYEYLWKNTKFSAEVNISGESSHSYEFFNVVENTAQKLSEIFKISNKELFLKKFKMACSGNGDEITKITTLHSSSLCALLFFYNVTKTNKLVFPYPELKDIEFYDSLFEVKNKVIRFPSNIDVVLIGENKEKKKVLLFLESKFSEYILGITKKGNKYELGKGYVDSCDTKKIYCDETLTTFGLKLDKSKKDKYYLIPDSDCYVEGIKQMVSHHVGIRNLLTSGVYDKNEKEVKNNLKDILTEKPQVYLGEILFDNFDISQTELLNNYENDYSKIANLLNESFDNHGVKVLKKSLRYSIFNEMNFKLDDMIRDFYKIETNQ